MRGKKFSDEEWREYYDLYISEEEMTLDDVATAMGNTPSTVSNHFRRLGLPAKRKGNGAIMVSADEDEPETVPVDEQTAEQAADEMLAEIAAEPMTPAHPDYDAWRRGTEPADLPAFWQPPQPPATNGTHDVGAQTITPSLLAELAKLARDGRVSGRVSIQLNLNFDIGERDDN